MSADSLHETRSEFSGTRDAAQKLARDAGQVKDDLVGLAHDAADVAKAGLGDAKAGMRRAAGAAGEAGSASLESLKTCIEDHPLASVGVALGVGVLLGLTLCRRS